MILNPDLGADDAFDWTPADAGPGDPGEDVDGDDSDEPARSATAGCILAGSM